MKRQATGDMRPHAPIDWSDVMSVPVWRCAAVGGALEYDGTEGGSAASQSRISASLRAASLPVSRGRGRGRGRGSQRGSLTRESERERGGERKERKERKEGGSNKKPAPRTRILDRLHVHRAPTPRGAVLPQQIDEVLRREREARVFRREARLQRRLLVVRDHARIEADLGVLCAVLRARAGR